MVKAIRFAIKYSHLIPHFIDFIEVCIDAAGDKKLSKKERGLMLKKYYALVKVIQTSYFKLDYSSNNIKDTLIFISM